MGKVKLANELNKPEVNQPYQFPMGKVKFILNMACGKDK